MAGVPMLAEDVPEATGPMRPGNATDVALAEPGLNRVVQLARERFGAREVWLFGSRARGDGRPDSDWDILVVLDDHSPDELLDPICLWQIGRDAGLAADVLGERMSDLRASEDVASTLSYEVKREGIRLG